MNLVCAECGSRLRPEDAWCSLCLTPVASAGQPAAPGPPAVVAEAVVDEEVGADEVVDEEPEERLPEGWEDGVVVTGPRRGTEQRALALASADRLIAELAASERTTSRHLRLGRLQYEVAERTGLAPQGAGMLIGVAGGCALLLVLVLALTVLGMLV